MYRRMGTSHRQPAVVNKQPPLGAPPDTNTVLRALPHKNKFLRKPEHGLIAVVVARVCVSCHYSRKIERFDRVLKTYAAETEGYYDERVLEEHLRGEFKRYLEELMSFDMKEGARRLKNMRMRLPFVVRERREAAACRIANLEEEMRQYELQCEFQAKYSLEEWVENRILFLIGKIEEHILHLAEHASAVRRSHPRGFVIRKCFLGKKRRYTYLIVDTEKDILVKSVMSSRNFRRWCRTRFSRKELAERNRKRDRESRDYRNLPALRR